MSTTALVALGANLGEAQKTLQTVALRLKQMAQTNSFRASYLYQSAPVEASGPDYLNAVVSFDTHLNPLELLNTLQQLENEYGRIRHFKNAPRTLDLDLLLFGNMQIQTEQLTLPHPRMHLRSFVLRPLIDLELENLTIAPHGKIADLELLTRDQTLYLLCENWLSEDTQNKINPKHSTKLASLR